MAYPVITPAHRFRPCAPPGCRFAWPDIENHLFRGWRREASSRSQHNALGVKGRRLGKTVAFLAQTPGSATIESQQSCLKPGDIEVLAGRKAFNQLSELLDRKGIGLEAGDRVKVYELSCLAIATPMLVRAITKLLRNGVSFEICTPRITVEPGVDDKLHAMLDVLDSHYRHLHGIKTHPAEMSPPGRKRLLGPDKLPEIRQKLSAPGATATDVAQELGVARSTLFNYLERYDLDRRAGREKKGVNRLLENSGDDSHVAESDRDETAS